MGRGSPGGDQWGVPLQHPPYPQAPGPPDHWPLTWCLPGAQTTPLTLWLSGDVLVVPAPWPPTLSGPDRSSLHVSSWPSFAALSLLPGVGASHPLQLLYICGFPHRLILCPGQLARPHTPCSCPVASHTYPLDIIVPHIIPAPTAPAHRWLSPPSPIPAPRPCWEYFPKTLTTTSFPLFSPHVTPRQKLPMTRDLVRALCCCSLGAQYRPAPGHCSGDGGFPLCSCPLGGLVHGHSVGSFPQKGVGMLLVG